MFLARAEYCTPQQIQAIKFRTVSCAFWCHCSLMWHVRAVTQKVQEIASKVKRASCVSHELWNTQLAKILECCVKHATWQSAWWRSNGTVLVMTFWNRSKRCCCSILNFYFKTYQNTRFISRFLSLTLEPNWNPKWNLASNLETHVENIASGAIAVIQHVNFKIRRLHLEVRLTSSFHRVLAVNWLLHEHGI